jgi:Family of unknown function (DUF6629)
MQSSPHSISASAHRAARRRSVRTPRSGSATKGIAGRDDDRPSGGAERRCSCASSGKDTVGAAGSAIDSYPWVDGWPASRRVRFTRVCFSPQADFFAGAVVAGVGLETLRHVRARCELIVGALPLLFGIHQLVEGFVWLGLRGQVSRGLGDVAKEAYILYAHAVLPAIVPLGFMLLEPDRTRSRVMMAMAGVGALLGVYLLWQVTAYPVGARAGSLHRVHDAHPK